MVRVKALVDAMRRVMMSWELVRPRRGRGCLEDAILEKHTSKGADPTLGAAKVLVRGVR